MKVLFLSSRADLGGGPEHLYQLLKHAPSDIECFVGCPNDEPYCSRFSETIGDDRIIEIPHRSLTLNVLVQLRREIIRSSIDIIHSHGKGAGIYARLLAAATGVPCVHTFHGLHVGSYGKFKKKAYLTLERILGWRTRQAICVSEGERQLILKAGFIASKKLKVIENGVVIPTAPRRRSKNDVLNMIAVNRYDHQKNPELLVEIARQLKGKLPFKLRVIGTGESESAIAQLVQDLGLADCVEICGGVNNPRDFFREADVFLSTSRWEGMPLAVLEAMSESVCPIVTDVVGNRDIITTRENGLLFSTAEEAAEVIYESYSSGSYLKYGMAAYQFVNAHHSIDSMAAQTFGVLRRAVGSSTPGTS